MRSLILGAAAALVLAATTVANAEEVIVRDHPNGNVTVREHARLAPVPRDNVIVRHHLYDSAAPGVVIKDRIGPRRDGIVIRDR